MPNEDIGTYLRTYVSYMEGYVKLSLRECFLG